MSLRVEFRDGVCRLRLDTPPGNILDRASCRALSSAVREHAADRGLKAFVLSGEGRHFSYGASVREHVAGEVESFLPAFHGVFRALADACVPAIAAVRGACLGGAFELAAFCDWIVAEESASFAAPEVRLGVFPPVACIVFPWRYSGARACELVLGGGGARARDVASRVCPDGGLDAAVESLLDEAIRPRSAAALRFATRALRGGLHEELARRLPGLEALYLRELMSTRDANEGIAAFLEKREPAWTHA